MVVYVHSPRLVRVWIATRQPSFFLLADSDCELEDMARLLRLPPEAYQRGAGPHGVSRYELNAQQRRFALAAGAVEVSTADLRWLLAQ